MIKVTTVLVTPLTSYIHQIDIAVFSRPTGNQWLRYTAHQVGDSDSWKLKDAYGEPYADSVTFTNSHIASGYIKDAIEHDQTP